MTDYVQITSISIDMSTEEAPYNRIYAKPIEKQGDVLLCEFESANYDIEQKDLKEQNAQLKELLKKANKFLKDYGFTFDGKDCAEAFKVHTKINEVLK